MTDKVLYEADGHIVTITLNDPGMRNPISEAEMVDGIVNALERLNQDRAARVAICGRCNRSSKIGRRNRI
jgi:enoyl-CoA hydratase/carnithine racemase